MELHLLPDKGCSGKLPRKSTMSSGIGGPGEADAERREVGELQREAAASLLPSVQLRGEAQSCRGWRNGAQRQAAVPHCALIS